MTTMDRNEQRRQAALASARARGERKHFLEQHHSLDFTSEIIMHQNEIVGGIRLRQFIRPWLSRKKRDAVMEGLGVSEGMGPKMEELTLQERFVLATALRQIVLRKVPPRDAVKDAFDTWERING